ncbi:hypothetical protein [Streptomyces akebiae]|uniref:hypothetical protein n=1 Tax=Streptomyces akebiae TaxID=2865673 RepID=UPI0021756DA7|nr:hypothetical protein [Streptomyces akebiae]
MTTAGDQVGRRPEVRAPLASRRPRTLAELRETGIPTFAFVGPLLPHSATRPELLDHLRCARRTSRPAPRSTARVGGA